MPDPEIVAHIEREMDGWDGRPDEPTGRVPQDWAEWAQEMWDWGRRVRRDILVLEYHLFGLLNQGDRIRERDEVFYSEFYGDPGDPPLPPGV